MKLTYILMVWLVCITTVLVFVALIRPAPVWQCAAEDEVVVKGNTCVHVDAL